MSNSFANARRLVQAPARAPDPRDVARAPHVAGMERRAVDVLEDHGGKLGEDGEHPGADAGFGRPGRVLDLELRRDPEQHLVDVAAQNPDHDRLPVHVRAVGDVAEPALQDGEPHFPALPVRHPLDDLRDVGNRNGSLAHDRIRAPSGSTSAPRWSLVGTRRIDDLELPVARVEVLVSDPLRPAHVAEADPEADGVPVPSRHEPADRLAVPVDRLAPEQEHIRVVGGERRHPLRERRSRWPRASAGPRKSSVLAERDGVAEPGLERRVVGADVDRPGLVRLLEPQRVERPIPGVAQAERLARRGDRVEHGGGVARSARTARRRARPCTRPGARETGAPATTISCTARNGNASGDRSCSQIACRSSRERGPTTPSVA